MQKKTVKRSMEVLRKSTMVTSMEKISVILNESMHARHGSDGSNVSDGRNGSDGSNGLYACVSMMAKMVHMLVCLYGLCVLDGLYGAIQPLGVGMY